MSQELQELRLMARAERERAWAHAKVLPARAGEAASAFAKRHPVLAMGSAAAITMALIARHRRRAGIEGKQGSWPAALAVVGVKFLPEILKLAGIAAPPADDEIDDAGESGTSVAKPAPVGVAESAVRRSEPTPSHQ